MDRTELNAAKQYGVHYQIVNHTLRRQQDCLFSRENYSCTSKVWVMTMSQQLKRMSRDV